MSFYQCKRDYSLLSEIKHDKEIKFLVFDDDLLITGDDEAGTQSLKSEIDKQIIVKNLLYWDRSIQEHRRNTLEPKKIH